MLYFVPYTESRIIGMLYVVAPFIWRVVVFLWLVISIGVGIRRMRICPGARYHAITDLKDSLAKSLGTRVEVSIHVNKYIKGEGGYVIMTEGHHVDISRRKKEEFLNMPDKI